jgi:hypothetical protein
MSEQKSRRDFIQSSALKTAAGLGLASASLGSRSVAATQPAPLKAYLWVLQNPHIAAINSNLWDETFIRENLALAGKKVELQPA